MFTLLGVVYGTASSMHRETRSGMLARLLIAPLGFGRMMYAKLALRAVIGGAQMLVLLLWGRLVFGVSLGTSPTAVLLISLATGFAAVGLGAFVAGLGKSDAQVLPLTLAIVLPLAAISGLWWPLHRQPDWMQDAAQLAFPSWAMQGVTNLVLRDRGLASIGAPGAVLLAEGLVLMVLGVWMFRLRVATR
jgi:ABC-2 type transport system permease protein